MFFFVMIWILVNLGLLQFAKWSTYKYDPAFCRDACDNLGMFAYKSDIEEARKKLNCSRSKF